MSVSVRIKGFTIDYGAGVTITNMTTNESIYFQPGDDEAEFQSVMAQAEAYQDDYAAYKGTRPAYSDAVQMVWDYFSDLAQPIGGGA